MLHLVVGSLWSSSVWIQQSESCLGDFQECLGTLLGVIMGTTKATRLPVDSRPARRAPQSGRAFPPDRPLAPSGLPLLQLAALPPVPSAANSRIP